MLLKYSVFILCVTSISGFLHESLCNVFPQYEGGIPDSVDFEVDVDVPVPCKNGTFRWDYPRGHATVTFHNLQRTPMKVCFKDSLGGDVFNITDQVHNKPIGAIDYKHWSCTDPITLQLFHIKIDAPTELRYMGEVEYKLM